MRYIPKKYEEMKTTDNKSRTDWSKMLTIKELQIIIRNLQKFHL